MTPVLLDPGRNFVDIVLLYTEERSKGSTQFHFIKTSADRARWQHLGIKTLKTSWRRMTWKDQNYMYSRSIRNIPNQLGFYNLEFDGAKYRDLKLKTCLKNWDAKDDEGKDIPLTPETIDGLYPELATELLNMFEKETEISSEELKMLEEATKEFFSGKYNFELRGLPAYVYEHILCDRYKWTLDYVRSIDYYDFQAHLKLCLTVDEAKKEAENKEIDKANKKYMRKGGGPMRKTMTRKII